MHRTKTLLVLGSSNVTFQSDGSSTTALLAKELDAIEPHAWVIRGVDLAPGRKMADEAVASIDAHRPDVALLSLNAQPSVYESVLIKVRRRWPRLLAAASAVEAWLRPRGGASASVRGRFLGWSYRAAQNAALATIGGETALAVEHNIENVSACLQRLAGREDTPLLVRLPVGGAPTSRARAARYDARLRRLKAGITEACGRHRIPYVDIAERLGEAGAKVLYGADNAHLAFETRRLEARELAARLTSLVERNAPFGG
ncbi:MAG TPA: hypothetical protein VH951_07505 [Dehalococcoidia bacterium]